MERLLMKTNVSVHDPLDAISSRSGRGKMGGENRRTMCRRRMKMGKNRKRCRKCKGRKNRQTHKSAQIAVGVHVINFLVKGNQSC